MYWGKSIGIWVKWFVVLIYGGLFFIGLVVLVGWFSKFRCVSRIFKFYICNIIRC